MTTLTPTIPRRAGSLRDTATCLYFIYKIVRCVHRLAICKNHMNVIIAEFLDYRCPDATRAASHECNPLFHINLSLASRIMLLPLAADTFGHGHPPQLEWTRSRQRPDFGAPLSLSC